VPDINVAQLFIAFSVLLFSLTIHESAHAWTADRLGDPTARRLGRVSINPLVHADPVGTIAFPLLAMLTGFPLIGWAKPVPVVVSQLRHQRKGFVLVAAAGPASNLLLAFGAAAILAAFPVAPVVLGEPNVSAPMATLLNRAVQINLLLAVFNLIPVPPLDGGNVVSGLLPRGLALGFDRLRPYGIFVLYALLLTGGFSAIVVPPYNFLRSLLP
jgi:Zn-dependent protease